MGYSDVFYNEGYFDLIIAQTLGHEYNPGTQGADAYEYINGEKKSTEYKTIKKNENGYKGKSFQFHWLSENKMKKLEQCENFYFVWRDELKIEKVIKVPRSQLWKDLEKQAVPCQGKKATNCHKSFSAKKIEQLLKDGKAHEINFTQK
ncbi:MAG: hypothetical protein MUF71_17710 [Candidatus Kapabacteria bacterium]|jgi:hypothetical protein|nr:hypothetical protein [Candidatus Kapabacteria bacterium]